MSMSIPPPIPPALVQARDEFNTAQTLFLTFTAILIWDSLASFPKEYEAMWKKKQAWSLMRVLFFVNRYGAVVALIFACVYTFGPIPVDVCRKSYWTLLLTGDFVFVVCDAILLVRVYAVYDRSRSVLVVLFTLWLAEIGILAWGALEPGPLILAPDVAEIVGYRGCAASVPPERAVKAAFLGWAPSLIMNIIVLLMILWKSVSVRIRVGTIPLLQQIQNDGILYFFVVVSINVISLGFAARE
ncbi:hypothetical protein JCM3765_003367 [Sporobolomyces pararoseus]